MPGFWMLKYVQIIDGIATELTDAGNFTPLIQTPHNCRLPEGWVKSSFTSKTNQHCTVVTSCQIHRYRVAWWLLIVAQPGFRLAANISLSNFTLQGWSQVLTTSTTVYKFCCCWDHKLRGSRFSYQRLRAGWNEGWTWWSSWLTHQPTPKLCLKIWNQWFLFIAGESRSTQIKFSFGDYWLSKRWFTGR